MKLYTWQKECIRAWQANHFHGMVHVVTGAGKTVMALYSIRLLEKYIGNEASLRVKIVVPTFPLAAQWAFSMEKYLPDCKNAQEKPGFFHSGKTDSPHRKYMIYIINSARYNLARHILSDIQQGYPVLLIADECHHYASPENRKIFDFLTAGVDVTGKYFSLGLSATPQAMDYDTILVPNLGREIFQYGFSEAARRNNICRFSIFQVALSFSPKEMEEYQQISERLSVTRRRLLKKHPYLKYLDRFHFFSAVSRLANTKDKHFDPVAPLFLNQTYRRQALNHMASARISCLVSLVEQLPSTTRILVFCERIHQAEKAWQILSAKYPNQAGRYHSELNRQARKNTLERFHDGSQRILISCRALDEGIDVPDAAVGIVLSGSSVSRQRTQRLGRILRRQNGKHSACLYYFYIRESTEDSVFLSDQESFGQDNHVKICDISYLTPENAFLHPAYEDTARSLLEDMSLKGWDKLLMDEMRRCLLSGLVRPDWLMSPEDCSQQIERAANQREKNYWICMKRMALERETKVKNNPF